MNPSRSVLELWRLGGLSPMMWALAATYNLVLGCLLHIGGPERVASQSFAAIRDVGGIGVAGTGFIALGVLIAVSVLSTRRVVASVYAAGALAHCVFAAGFVAAAFSEPKAALIGAPTYVFVALLHIANARLYWRFQPQRGDVA